MQTKTKAASQLPAMDRMEKFALNLFLSLSLHEVIKHQLGSEKNEKLRDWILEQVVVSAEILFPDAAEA